MILVKTNLVDVLERELARPSWSARAGRARHRDRPLSADRRALPADARGARSARSRARRRSASSPRGRWSSATSTCCATSPQRASCTVCMSVPTVDEDAWRRLEPGTAHPLQRLRAVRDAGRRRHPRRRADGAARARHLVAARESSSAPSRRSPITAPRFVGCNVMYLEGRHAHALHARSSNASIPHLSQRYETLYAAGKRAEPGYAAQVARHGQGTAAARRPDRRGRGTGRSGTREAGRLERTIAASGLESRAAGVRVGRRIELELRDWRLREFDELSQPPVRYVPLRAVREALGALGDEPRTDGVDHDLVAFEAHVERVAVLPAAR